MNAMTWNDDEESNSEEEAKPKEVANLYLIAHEKDNEVPTSNSSQFTFNELQDAFDDLFFEFKKIKIKNSILKRTISTLFKENEFLQKKNEVLKNEVCVLNENVKHLKITLFRCVNEKKKFDVIFEK